MFSVTIHKKIISVDNWTTSILEVLKTYSISLAKKTLLVKIDNKIISLDTLVDRDCVIEPIDIDLKRFYIL